MKYERITERRETPLVMSMWAGDSGSLKIYNRLIELENKIENGEIDYVSDKDAEIARLTAENAELRERLDKAIEPPVKIGDKKYAPDCRGTMVLEETVVGVRLSYDKKCGVCVDCVETRTQRGAAERLTYPQWQTLLYDTREAAEARLKELQGGVR